MTVSFVADIWKPSSLLPDIQLAITMKITLTLASCEVVTNGETPSNISKYS